SKSKSCGEEGDKPFLPFHTKIPEIRKPSTHSPIPQILTAKLLQSAMAKMIMASSKPFILSPSASLLPSPTTATAPAKPKLPNFSVLLRSKIPQSHQILSLKSASSLLAASISFAAMAPPSLAAEMEKAALFDFDLTLPIMVVQFLLLMVGLDKVYYTPLGKVMDERDAAIKEKLNSVKDTSTEVKQLEEQAAAIMRAARAEIAAALNKMKKETQVEVEAKIKEGRMKIEAELQEALAKLEQQKDETILALDAQIGALSEDIVKKVLPGYVKS
ncbi:ATP synthase subunit b', chloroplastic, partial [Linum grandiflorum]